MQVAFEMMATGTYQIEELRKILYKKGLKKTRNTFWEMLRNPVYAGKIYVPATKHEVAELVPAKHAPLVSESLFYDTQDALEGRKAVKYSSTLCQRENLPLRGFLKCRVCGKMLCGSSSKGRSARYVYYHCTVGCKERYKAEIVNESFIGMLKDISAQRKALQTCQILLGNSLGQNKKGRAGEIATFQKELDVITKRLDSAQLLMLDGNLEPNEYKIIRSKLAPEKERLEAKINSLGTKKDNDAEAIDFGFYFLTNLHSLFTSADLSLKRRIIGSMFPAKMILKTEDFEPLLAMISLR